MNHSAQKLALQALLLQSPLRKQKQNPNLLEARQIYLGTLEHYFELDEWLNQKLLNKPLKSKHEHLLWILLLGLYQIRYMRTPDHAAVSETVKLAKLPWEKKLINGCLRNACRDPSFAPQTEQSKFNHPDWFIDKLKQAYPEHWQNILKANMQKAPNTFRVIEHKKWLATTDHHDVIAPTECVNAIIIPTSTEVQQLPGYEQGEIFVQDQASQFAVPLLDLKPNQRVLDACSAPGGKACHIGQLEKNLANLTCVEIAENRISQLQENLQRARVDADIICSDILETQFSKQFDRILLDAPCSATGIIRRHPDIKLKRTPEDIDTISKLQLRILNHLWQFLKHEGLLLYTTCSILPEENELIIEKFLNEQANASTADFTVPGTIIKKHGQQLIPIAAKNEDMNVSPDGFYYCLLKKNT